MTTTNKEKFLVVEEDYSDSHHFSHHKGGYVLGILLLLTGSCWFSLLTLCPIVGYPHSNGNGRCSIHSIVSSYIMIVQVICWTLVVTMIFFVSLMKPIKAALHAYLDAVTEGRVLSLKRRIEKRIVGGNNHHYSYHLIENYEIRYQHDMKNSNVDNGDSPSAICSYLFEHEEARDLHIPVPLFDWNVSLFGSKPALEQAQDKMESTPSKWQEGATLTVSVVPESPRAAMVHNDKLPLTIILIYLFLHFNLIILGSFLGSFLFLFEGPFQDGVIRYIPAYACTFLGCGIIAQQQRLRISAKPIIETVVVEEDCYQSMSSPGKASTENSCLL